MLFILENVNLKLRKSTDDVKNDLLNLQLDTSKFDQLKQMKISDMSLREFTELIIYKNLVQINQQVSEGANNLNLLNEKIFKFRKGL